MKPFKCKFCHKDVLFGFDARVYELDGKTLHVENCPNRREHFKALAANNAEERRRTP